MNTQRLSTITKAATLAVATGLLGLASAAPAAARPIPSYANGTTDKTISGTVSAINGKYNISVRDARGYIDNVTLHQGTIINPTGLTLEPGQSVTILGQPNGRTFDANEINTPYQTVYAVPVDPYGYYPGYGYGFGYPFGFGFGFGFNQGYGFGYRG